MTEGERQLLADAEEQVRNSSARFLAQEQTTGIRPPPLVEVIDSPEPELSPFGMEFGDTSSYAEPSGGGGDCPECPSVSCAFSETVSGAVSGVPATLDACTPDATGWVPI